MKIKKEVEMNLAEIIDWGWKNPLLSYGKLYKKDDKEFGDYVSFDHQTNEVRVCGKIDCDDLFTVEVEEEITEDTVIPKMLVKFKNPDTYGRFKNDSINGFEIEEGNIEAFYILNDDYTMTLIWRDGKLVE